MNITTSFHRSPANRAKRGIAARVGWMSLAFFMLLCTVFIKGSAGALTQCALESFTNKQALYDPCTECNTSSSSSTGTASGAQSGVWNSGVQQPANLEQFVVEVLKDIAAKLGKPQEDAVTSEHVLALIAFADGEGGNLTNSDLYNPWNTGIDAPDLLASGHDVSGVQSFKSFDAGVEANARVMTGPLQNRLGNDLVDPNSTAAQFMSALTYFNRYPGNKLWAEASVANPDQYYQERLSLIDNVKAHYADIASYQMGPPGNSQTNNLHVNRDKLQFVPKGSSSSTSASTGTDSQGQSSGCTIDTGATGTTQAIAAMALKLSWPDGSHGLTPTPAYVTALDTYNKVALASYNGADCGGFVATVLRASGADKNYPGLGTGGQETYMKGHPNLYKQIPNTKSTGNLQPGDIFIINVGSGQGADGHTYIYVGPQPGGKNAAMASEGSDMPYQTTTFFSDNRGDYDIFRFIGNSSAASTAS